MKITLSQEVVGSQDKRSWKDGKKRSWEMTEATLRDRMYATVEKTATATRYERHCPRERTKIDMSTVNEAC